MWVKVSGFLVVPRPRVDCRQLWGRCGEKLVNTDVEKFCEDVDRAVREALMDYGCPVRRVSVDLGWGNVYAIDEGDKTRDGGNCIDVIREVVKSRYDVTIIPFVGSVLVLLV